MKVVLSASVSALALIGASPAPAAQTFTDPAGDGGGAPDVTTVTVSNSATNRVTVRVVTPSHAALPGDGELDLFLDTDANTGTGNEDGTDYIISVDGREQAFGLFKWDGSDFQFQDSNTVSVAWTGGPTVSFDASELGNTTAFNFWVGGFKFTGEEETARDEAPNEGAWTYQLATPVTVKTMAAAFSAKTPKAKARFSVRAVALELSDRSAVRATTYTCVARLAGKVLRPAARCAWKLPANAKGKRLVITITVTFRGERITFDPYVFRVG
jgi:hypothetical protein